MSHIDVDAADSRGITTYLGTSNVGTLINRTGATFNIAGVTTVAGTATNEAGGTLNQSATINATTTVNQGQWNVDTHRTLNTGTLAGEGTFSVAASGSNLTINQSGNSTFACVFSGLGSITKAGAGTLVLIDASTNTGGTIVQAGTLDTTGGGTLADTGAITVGTGATFIAGTADTVGAVSNSGTLQINAAQTVASLDNLPGAVVNQQANLTSPGNVVNQLGGVFNQNADISAAIVGNSGTLNLSGSRLITTGDLVGDASGRLVLGSPSDKLTLDQSGNSVYAGQINGQGSFEKLGLGALNLTGSNNFGGGLTITAGAIDTTGGGQLLDTGTVTIANGSTFVAGTADTIGTVANSGTVFVNAAQTVASLANTATGVSNINAVLTSTSTVSNASGGIVNLASDILATSTVTNDGTLNVSGLRLIDSGAFQGAGGTVIAADSVLTVQQTANSTYAGIISGPDALIKTQTGSLTLTGQTASAAAPS